MEQWKEGGKPSQGWRLHGDVCSPEQALHLEGLQRGWSETHLLVEGPDSGHVVANAACGREAAGEVGDEQPHGGDVWIEEVGVAVIAELDERLCL